jgi:hypothetical protein
MCTVASFMTEQQNQKKKRVICWHGSAHACENKSSYQEGSAQGVLCSGGIHCDLMSCCKTLEKQRREMNYTLQYVDENRKGLK